MRESQGEEGVKVLLRWEGSEVMGRRGASGERRGSTPEGREVSRVRRGGLARGTGVAGGTRSSVGPRGSLGALGGEGGDGGGVVGVLGMEGSQGSRG